MLFLFFRLRKVHGDVVPPPFANDNMMMTTTYSGRGTRVYKQCMMSINQPKEQFIFKNVLANLHDLFIGHICLSTPCTYLRVVMAQN